MAVIVVPKFSRAQIQKMLAERQERIMAAILLNLKRVGERFVRNARENDTYKDRTVNLRSSIGYVILRNGDQLFESFESKGGPEGVKQAQKIIEQSKKNFPKGFVLIGVAGMDYAAAVEAKGYDVLTASSLQAETDLKIAMARIARKTKKK